jgi:hypothetical protein
MSMEIVCEKCEWSWDLKDGGKEPYLCHKCGKNNSEKYKMKNEMLIDKIARLVIEQIDTEITQGDVESLRKIYNKVPFDVVLQWFNNTDNEYMDMTDLQMYIAYLEREDEEEEDLLNEAKYQGRTVTLNKPFLTPDGPKKRSVYVKNDKGNIVKVNFGDPNMRIKKSDPERRKSFRARHKCDTPGPKWMARYWSCKAW